MKNINEMSRKEKLGQTLIVGIFGAEIDAFTEKFIKEYKVGGIIIFRRNVESEEQLINLINNIKTMNKEAGNLPIYISVDYEGGRVNRMPKNIKKFPSANQIYKTGDLEYAKNTYKEMGQVLNKFGINMDFAPVLDLKIMEEDNHPIGDRAIDANEDEVIRFGEKFLLGLKEENILAVVKHFPGHGLTLNDTHRLLPKISCTKEKLEKHIKPFLKVDSDAMLVSHMLVKCMDKNHPVSLSKKIITGYLKNTINYSGLIITDDLMMRGLMFRCLFKIPIKEAIEAGSDMVLLCKENKRKEKAIQKYFKCKILDEIIDEKVKKILSIKQKYNINDNEIKN